MNIGHQPERDGNGPTKSKTSKTQDRHYRRPTVEAVDDYSDTSPPEHENTHVAQESSQSHPPGSGSPQSHSYSIDHSYPAEPHPQSGQASHIHVTGQINSTTPANETQQKKPRKSVSFHPCVAVYGALSPEGEPCRIHLSPVDVEYKETEPYSQPGQAPHTHVPEKIDPIPLSQVNGNTQRNHRKSVLPHQLIVVYGPTPPVGEPRRVHFNPVNVVYEPGGAGSVYSTMHPSRSLVEVDIEAPLETMLDKNGDLLKRYY